MCVAAASFILYFFVKTELPGDAESEESRLNGDALDASLNWEETDALRVKAKTIETRSPARNRLFGALISVFAGCVVMRHG